MCIRDSPISFGLLSFEDVSLLPSPFQLLPLQQFFEKRYMSIHLSEQEQLRREKLAELIMMGIDPYPAALYPVNGNASEIKKNFTEEKKDEFADVCVAGRIMSVRDRGC